MRNDSLLHEWQRHRGLTDDFMAAALGISRPTWVKWRDKTGIPHETLVTAVNLCRVPEEDARKILMGGYRP